MTREEAIEIVEMAFAEWEHEFYVSGDDWSKEHEALDMAIKALKQEPILYKIKAEIMQLDYDIESVDYDYNDMPQTEEVHMICREEVLRIIDKYKAESEDK